MRCENQKKLHTALPAQVVSFNAENQTVTLACLVKQVLVGEKTVDIPPLVDVPVSFPRGGGFAITFPLQKGDEGMAIFSERCIDGWWQSGRESSPLDYRFHDLSDAMFIPGICSVPKAIQGFFTGGLSLQTLSGDTFIRMTEAGIQIKGDIQHEGNQTSSGIITGQKDVIAAGKSGKSHTHPGDSGGMTGAPQ